MVQPIQPSQILRYFCRVCRKGYRGMAALRRHERDAHGPRMRCSQCDFTCPERRHFEMKRHKEMKHGILSTITPHQMQDETLHPPTIRVPPSPLAVDSYTLSSNSFISALNDFDLGPEPDVSINEPLLYVPSYGPLPSSELSVSIAVSVPSFNSNSSLSTPTLASVSSPSLPSPAVLSPSLPSTFSTIQPYSPSDTLQASPASPLPLLSPSLPEQAANESVPPPTLVSGTPVQGSVSYTPTPLVQLCSSASLSYSTSISCSASLSSSASISTSASLITQSAQPSTVPTATATVSEPLVSPRISAQTELSSQTLALSLLSSSTSTDILTAITNLSNMVRPRGVDMGTQTDEKTMKDQSTELKWVLN